MRKRGGIYDLITNKRKFYAFNGYMIYDIK